MQNQVISCKELAGALNRSMPYIQAMKNRGFPMQSGRTTLAKAMKWLEKHPKPLSKK
jgi:hypothetical protein